MEVVYPVCCGIDVHQAVLTACLRRVEADGKVAQEVREFGTTYQALLALCDWLVEQGCPIAAMESTGVYWKPVHHVLAAVLEVVVANARDVKQRTGRKTDKADARWIAELLAHGLLRPSFVPPPEIGALREAVRMRTGLVQTRSQFKNRVHKVLEDTNIKLSSVISDVFGQSGRKMLRALIDGERDPETLARMALGVLRRKIPLLEVALVGNFTPQHALLIRTALAMVDAATEQIRDLEEYVETLLAPMEEEMAHLSTIPGVDRTSAAVILSEIGTDMTRFGSSSRLASWAGLCPGNNESAGKRRSGRTPKGNRHLRRILVQLAWVASKTDSYLGRRFRTLQARLGGKKAAVAVAHQILVICYHLLSNGTVYDERRLDRPNPRRDKRLAQKALKTLERLGYAVTLAPKAA